MKARAFLPLLALALALTASLQAQARIDYPPGGTTATAVGAMGFIDPRDYGATCGGATYGGSGRPVSVDGHDDTDGFEAAAAAAITAGKSLLVPNGCWVTDLQLPSGTNMVGFNKAVDYGYDMGTNSKPFSKPVLYIIGAPTFGINLNAARTISFSGFRIDGNADASAYGATTGIGSTVGSSGFGAKVFVDDMSFSGFLYGIRPTGGYVFMTISNSDFGANQTGVAGTVSDLALYNNTFVSGETGVLLESGNGAFVNITGGRFEYLGQGIVGNFVNELNIGDVLFDHFRTCAIQLNNSWQSVNITGGAIKSGGTSGSLKVTGAADNGSGLIRLTVDSDSTSNGGANVLSGVSTSDTITTAGITGTGGLTAAANGTFVVTKIDSTHLDLQGSTFAGAYTSGGYGGVWGKSANICLNGTAGARGLHINNVGFYHAAAVGGVAAPAFIVESTTNTTLNDYVEIIGGPIKSLAQSSAVNYMSYGVDVANWRTFGAPAHYRLDTVGSAPVRNDNTSVKWNVDTNSVLDLAGNTSSIKLPTGTTAQQPASPVAGMLRYNSDTPGLEAYYGAAWNSLIPGITASSTNTLTNKTYDTAGTGNVFKIDGTTITSISGNAAKVVTTTGTLTSGDCVSIDGDGNFVAAGGACTTGGGGGTVASSSVGEIPVYTGATTVTGSSGLTAASGVVTANSYIPASSTIPTSGLYAPSANVAGIASNSALIATFLSGGGINIASQNIGLQLGAANALRMPTSDSGAGNSVAIGTNALDGQTSSAAYKNTAIGYQAMNGTMTTAGLSNTAVGYKAANALTAGTLNTAIGNEAMLASTARSNSVAVGYQALKGTGSSSADNMVAVGVSALAAAVNGSQDSTAVGYQALLVLSNQQNATCVGSRCGDSTTGTNNTGIGTGALRGVSSGVSNTAVGTSALGNSAQHNITGAGNTAVGKSSLVAAQGAAANNTAIGESAGLVLTTGTGNTILGADVASTTLTTGTNNIIIGVDNSATTAASGTSNTALIKGTGTAVLSSTGTDSAAPVTSVGGPLINLGTKLTVAGSGGGCGTLGTVTGGSSAGTFNTDNTGACQFTVTFSGATGATAPNGWACAASNNTTANLLRQTESTTTTATFAGVTVASDILQIGPCVGY